MRRTPFAEGEWYHCYTRGVDKRTVFESPKEYERYLQLLYICNNDKIIHRSDLLSLSHEEILALPRDNPIVAVGAFALMPNHPHLLLKEIRQGGISQFMGRVSNAYTKYFNIKRERVGNLFVSPFRAKHVPSDLYFKHLVRYILLNPAELFESRWKDGEVRDLHELEQKLLAYPYASISEFWGGQRAESMILDADSLGLLTADLPPLKDLLTETAAYFQELSMSTPGVDYQI
jgi:REP element-mobilizing transposase RayT